MAQAEPRLCAANVSRVLRTGSNSITTASDATQFAWEGDKVIGETENSLFTYFLVKALQKSKAAVTYRDLEHEVKGNVEAACPGQLPQFEGTTLDSYVFSDSSSIAEPFIDVSPTGGKTVTFDGGQVLGLHESDLTPS